MSDFRKIAKEYTEAPITRQLAMEMLSEYKRPNDKISELIKSGELISVRRGLYITGPETDLPAPEPFLIANHLRGPSYVSLETALSYWGLIPERVYEISSVTIKSSRTYSSEAGRFSYHHLPTPYYSFGIESIRLTPKQTALVASKEKAVCDKIILTSGITLRSIRQTMDLLIDDLRMNEELLSELDTNAISSWIEDAPKSSSLEMLVKTLNKL